MAENSKIQWTDTTWQVTSGCEKVSAGCKHCYAMGQIRRLSGNPNAKISAPLQGLVTRNGNWTGTVVTRPDQLEKPLGWRAPRRVFVNSMSDLFHRDVPFSYIDQVFAVMALCPQHQFQVLTKRPERMAEYLGEFYKEFGRLERMLDLAGEEHTPLERASNDDWRRLAEGSVLPNVWLGTSVEDQATADARIPQLLRCPAAVRWVSYEPALGPVVFADDWLCNDDRCSHASVHWVVVGGESGRDARGFDLTWVRSTLRQCRAGGAACFVKQLGARPYVGPSHTGGTGYALTLRDRKGGDPTEWPEDLRVREWPAAVAAVSS